MKNIYITGATSFIGVNLIRELLKKDYNIVAIIRRNSKNKEKLASFKKIKIIELNMDEIDKLPNLINIKCDIFYHLAWNGTRGKDRDDKLIQEENYLNSLKVLEVAKKMKTKTFISAGSQAEYGINSGLITEDITPQPVTEYGIYKLKFYDYAKEFCKKNKIIFIEPRFFSLYGVGDYENTLVMSAIDKMLKNQELNLTECKQTWNYLNIKDAVRGLTLLQETNNSGIYNFGSTDTRILKEYIDEIYYVTKSKSKINYGIIPYPETGMVSINPSVEKLMNEINWYPEIEFNKGIEEIIEKRSKNEEN